MKPDREPDNMRHRKHGSKLNRTSEHRLALMRNLAVALLTHERIRTTHQKASALRPFLESLITIAKEDSIPARRRVNSRLQDSDGTRKLFEKIGPRVSERRGGYLRVIKDGPRAGDGALMSYIEFVDERPPDAEGAEPPPRRKSMKQRIHQRRKELAKSRK
jgi:large subunit ribosomal protein L17